MSCVISLAACGLTIDRIEAGPDSLLIQAQSALRTAVCPKCGRPSEHVHSRYQRSVADLSSQGHRVEIRLCTRRFRCTSMECPQKIFAERLAATAGRSLARLDGTGHRQVEQLRLQRDGVVKASWVA